MQDNDASAALRRTARAFARVGGAVALEAALLAACAERPATLGEAPLALSAGRTAAETVALAPGPEHVQRPTGRLPGVEQSEPNERRDVPRAAAPAADAPIQAPQSLAPAPAATLVARAEIAPVGGSEAHGEVSFYLAEPMLVLDVNVAGLKPGMHGFHVHENGDCGGPNAQATGAHLNPAGNQHGDPMDAAHRHHAGDLGNLLAGGDGTAKIWLRTKDLQLEGPAGVANRALVIHARRDDLKTQPAGDSGPPVGCGVIRMTPEGAVETPAAPAPGARDSSPP